MSQPITMVMKRTACLVALTLLFSRPGITQVSVQRLLTENLSSPIGLDSQSPRLSWQLETADRNELQTAYEIRVSDRENGTGIVWNSGKVGSGQSVQVAYGG